MLFELIATVTAGFAAAGLVLLIRRFVTLPRWAMPAGAGLAMLAFAIWSEYSWFDRTTGGLPDGIEVARTVESSAPWRPWTYAAPFVDRFIAVDLASVRTNDAVPDQRMVDLLVFRRWTPVGRVRAVFDCGGGRRADLVEGVNFTEDGRIEGANWVEMGPEDPVFAQACAGV